MVDSRVDMVYSQASISTYQTCALKFRFRYLDNLGWMQRRSTGDHTAERQLGEQFHLLAQRYYQGAASASLLQHIPPGPLAIWMGNLEQRFPRREGMRYYPEQQVTTEIAGIQVMAKYDLLMVDAQGVCTIYDWKTQAKPFKKHLRSMQERLYPMLLCEASLHGSLSPTSITMQLWNPRFPGEVQSLAYTEELYQEDRREISQILRELAELPYSSFTGIKPATGESPRECQICEFQDLCYKMDGTISLQTDIVTDWEDIEEIAYDEE